MEIFIDVLLDTMKDTAKTLPFLFLACLAVEYFEHKQNGKLVGVLAKGGGAGFAVGGVLGLLPQCGFSAMAANLYSGHIISLGTMLAVFISTSDEAIVIFMSRPEQIPLLVKLLSIKLVVALIVGFTFDYLLRNKITVLDKDKISCLCHKNEGEQSVFKAALLHTASLTFWIFLFSLIINLCMEIFGADFLASVITSVPILQPIVTAAIGLIPSCAASVLLAQLYLVETISFASLVAGLCSAAGLGLVVLIRSNKNIKSSLFAIFALYTSSALTGIVISLLGV